MNNARFQELINEGREPSEIVKDYMFYVRDELGELQRAKTVPQIVKEAIDVIIVCNPILKYGNQYDRRIHAEITKSMTQLVSGLDIDFSKALQAVEESNASKLIRASELVEAQAYFAKKGIKATFKLLGDEMFGAYSAEDQDNYPKGKLLKPHCYAPVDESKEFWL